MQEKNKKVIEKNNKNNENIFKCNKCKEYSLIDIGIEKNIFLCQNCGRYYEINYKTKRLVRY